MGLEAYEEAYEDESVTGSTWNDLRMSESLEWGEGSFRVVESFSQSTQSQPHDAGKKI